MAERASKTVRAILRVRPLNDKEQKISTNEHLRVNTEDGSVIVTDPREARKSYFQSKPVEPKGFKFNAAFGPNNTTHQIFDSQIKPWITELTNGFDVAIFAYGHTGSGKTYTIVVFRDSIELFRCFKSDYFQVSEA